MQRHKFLKEAAEAPEIIQHMEPPHITVYRRSYVINFNYAPMIMAYAFRKFCLFLTSSISVTDSLSTMLRLLGEESEEASWLI